MEKYPANLNLAHVFDLIQGERSAMTGVDGLDVEALQFFEASLRGSAIVHDRIERRPLCIFEQIADEEIAVGGEEADRAARMT